LIDVDVLPFQQTRRLFPFLAVQAVPAHSELQRRAGKGELDFARNLLPLATEAWHAIQKLEVVLRSEQRNLPSLPSWGRSDMCDDGS
jgi:hypothetical protein